MPRRDVHGFRDHEGEGCPDAAHCECECHTCKRVWHASGRPKPHDDEVIVAASDAAVEGIAQSLAEGSNFDFTVTAASIRESSETFVIIAWETKGAGFGELTLYRDQGRWKADTESMGTDFCKAVLARMFDQIVSPTTDETLS